jgi:hypothetical protein
MYQAPMLGRARRRGHGYCDCHEFRLLKRPHKRMIRQFESARIRAEIHQGINDYFALQSDPHEP